MSNAGGVYIREARLSDSAALSRICLLTGDAGQSAEHLHECGELIGLMYAEPYVHLPAGFGFVMVDPSRSDAVVGYILGTADTGLFEQQASDAWFPEVQKRYPYPPHHPQDRPLRSADERYIRIIHDPPRTSDLQIVFSPAHLHIDILPDYQRQGWGRRLMTRAIEYLKERGLDRLWLGLDPRNENAKKFYRRLGFEDLEGAPDGVMGLKF
ncbi:acyl-CoA N-acyltransferase [Daedalea quercina L-15889]|uniref:Acyl-CoA N-acyltransferase n=1 Tax=Daedalea quercina L-15889 TaxID=1314783 RepID=A0A165S7D1_9APHY|nr:acyl-CoA N-acyltransferase [Daedalea quercina L-15889]